MKKHTKFLIKFDLFLLFCCVFLITTYIIFPPQKNMDTPTAPGTTFAARISCNPGTDTGTFSVTETISPASEGSWSLILVNKWNYIPEDYETDLTELSNGQLVDNRIYPALQEMFDAARAEGIYPVVASGYRTAEKQQSLLDEKIVWYRSQGCSPEEARIKAEAWVAVPGTSEHQLGIAVDINADGIRSSGDIVYNWLDENSWKFGFIRRYPPDKTEITGVINEPWHYRYVGITAAAEIHQQGICLEEYLR